MITLRLNDDKGWVPGSEEYRLECPECGTVAHSVNGRCGVPACDCEPTYYDIRIGCPNHPGDPDHYPYQPSDWGDFVTPVGGCVECGIMPRKPAP